LTVGWLKLEEFLLKECFMAVGKDTIFERFLAPLMRLAIDEEALRRLYEGIDWETAADRYRQPDLVYPEYYSSQNFHGIKGGYLNPSAAVSYDPITQYVFASPRNSRQARLN
jgi:hypothetical protein